MKKIQSLGRSLSKGEQKMIAGGSIICVCSNMAAFICNGSVESCLNAGINFCAEQNSTGWSCGNTVPVSPAP
jgi:hypothetical protein